MNKELIMTGDGSHTLFAIELDETYHSRHGAIRESMHVFIWNGLRYYLSNAVKKNIGIFELGLGTGLNALLTALEARKFGCRIQYHAIEPFPLEHGLYKQLNYPGLLPESVPDKLFTEIHEAEWGIETPLTEHFIIKKEKITFEEYLQDDKIFDIVYYDAFAPGKQPEIWSPELLAKAYGMLVPDGVLVTYCSQGNFKRNLKQIGFKVENLTGPPGKKEMVRAQK
ncbi:MAG: tRNA (5-methylaminomethyl-2-thiouridine)(34)-methyltransferase MnmD [Cyclobacteriaceae bacterium]|nr:tRNA (5-methylaminomethyl-2-thiouridine)(34)-methyltransferase MnmD [Cyclobacteriaceae bacterium]